MAIWAACCPRLAATYHGPSPPQVRNAAADIVAGLTASPDGIEKLKAVQRPLIIKLWRAVGLGGESSRKALVSLVNLSHDPAVADQLLDLGAVNRVMELIRENSCPHADLLVGRKCLLCVTCAVRCGTPPCVSPRLPRCPCAPQHVRTLPPQATRP